MDRRLRVRVPPAFALLLVVVLAGCAAGTAPATPGTSAPPTGAPLGRDEAVARVLARDPGFAGIGPLDPDLIGQAAWYEVFAGTVGWRVVITKGWGDCQAGCISRHTWTWEVDGSGNVRLVEEAGDPLPDSVEGTPTGGGLPGEPPVTIPRDGGPWLAGRALAGPVCPVERVPPDPACADRPVGGATVVVRDAAGVEVARTTTAADGSFLVAVPSGGTWTVVAQPVEGLLGTPGPLAAEVPDGPGAWASVVLPYDTGIR